MAYAFIIYALGGSSGAYSSANCCTCFLETQATRNSGQQLGTKINTGNSLYHRELSPCLVAASFSLSDFPCESLANWSISPPSKRSRNWYAVISLSSQALLPQYYLRALPFPGNSTHRLQLSSVTGSALPTWKHLNTQSSLFTFKFFSTTQFKMFNPLNRPSFIFLGFFSRQPTWSLKKKIILLILKFTVLHRAHAFSFYVLTSLIQPCVPLARGFLQPLPSLTELR